MKDFFKGILIGLFIMVVAFVMCLLLFSIFQDIPTLVNPESEEILKKTAFNAAGKTTLVLLLNIFAQDLFSH